MTYKKGIDVSQWNGVIDWGKVKASGVQFAMLRAGYGLNVDPRFHANAEACNQAKIPIGIYWFSYAKNAAGAALEAEKCIETIKRYRIDYPVAFDLEDDSVKNASKSGIKITKKLASEMANAFLDKIQNAGYAAMNYTNPAYLASYFDASVTANYPVWLAQWPYNPNPEKPPRVCSIWQYSEKGRVPGISTDVDMDACYDEYPVKKSAAKQEEKKPEQPKEEKPMTGEQIYKALSEYLDARPLPEWAKAEWQEAIDMGITDGTRPMELVPRYQAALMAKRAVQSAGDDKK